MTKTLNQIIFVPPPKSEYFFQQHWESEYFFRKKTIFFVHRHTKLMKGAFIAVLHFLVRVAS